MARTRISTTVDDELLSDARTLMEGHSDSVVIDTALRALVAAHRRTEIDQRYAAYDDTPPDTPDAWGDLASFGAADAATSEDDYTDV